MFKNIAVGIFLAAALATTTSGFAQQWTAQILHPQGALESWLYGIADGQVVGTAILPGEFGVFVWSLDGTPTRLDGPGVTSPEVYDVSQGRQVGSAIINGEDRAVMWSGTPESIVDLGMPEADFGVAISIHKNVISGYLFDSPNISRAIAGNPQTGWQILGFGGSGETDGKRHVGYMREGFETIPVIWSPRPIRLDIGVSAMPSDTYVAGIHGDEQVGTWHENLGNQQAVVWYGSGKSYEFLSLQYSDARGVYGGQQVGSMWPQGAVRWVHQAGVLTELHNALPSKYTYSEAEKIWDDGEAHTYISGTAWMGSTRQGVVWKSNNIRTSAISAINVSPGVVVSGDLQSVQNSENNRLVLQPGITFLTSQPPIVVYAEGTAVIQDPFRIGLSVESQSSAVNTIQSVEFFDFESQTYVPRNTDRLLMTDDLYRSDQVRNVSRFVEEGTGKMRARVSFRARGPLFLYPWQVRIDRIWFHQLIS
jgi:hypothetical protein